jgi:arabinofuranosyltransferase
LVWNYGERVQVFTDPLWTLLLALVHAIGVDLYIGSILLGTLTTLAAVWVVAFRIGRTMAAVILVLPPLILSKAFIDFSTSGLENPLTFLATALFIAILVQRPGGPGRRLFLLSLVTSVALLNRLDVVLLFMPALLMEFFRLQGWRHLGAILAGAAPFLIWTLFSILYYGTPLPNTAYAKLNTGIPAAERMVQGWYYLLNSFTLDPITLPVILGGVALLVLRGGWRGAMLACGVVLYLIYIVRVGGDFMSGRFLAAPFFATLASIAAVFAHRVQQRHALIVAGIAILPGITNPYSPVLSDDRYHRSFELAVDRNGVADERAVFYWNMGFLHMNKTRFPDHHWREEAERASRNMEKEPVLVHANIGLLGYFAHPRLHILDVAALADPLLARLPALDHVRVGHFIREVPPGYLESLRTGTNQILHPSLAAVYDALALVVREPLFAEGRLREIYRLNTGYYDTLIQDYIDTRYKVLWPLNDLLRPQPFAQHISGWWGSSPQGTVWAMGPESRMVFDSEHDRPGVLSFSAATPFPTQRIDVYVDHEHAGMFEFSASDTLHAELPVILKTGRTLVTWSFTRWNSDADRFVPWTSDPNAVEFLRLGFIEGP